MSMTQEMLERLIGKSLDGDITPDERRILEAELDDNPGAKELFEHLRHLHERSSEAIACGVLEQGAPADEIFERAWRLRTEAPVLRRVIASGWLRFAAGLAAGLVIGLTLHFVLIMRPSASGPIAPIAEGVHGIDARPPVPVSVPTQDVIRNVDWYSFTDQDGTKWVIEGLRENRIRPAVYHGDL
jgi:anti-sigma factor RsiW